MKLAIEELGRLMVAKRGGLGVRAAADAVKVSTATYSRIENGHMPDLATFAKICVWLERNPNDFIGIEVSSTASEPEPVQVHLRKKKTVSRETAESLGALILAVQEAARAHNRMLG